MALPTTLNAVRAILESDQTIPPADRRRFLGLLRNGPQSVRAEAQAQDTERIVRRAAAAAMISRTPRFLDLLAREGVLAKVRVPGRKRALGFRLSDLRNFIAAHPPEAGSTATPPS
jgi:hypothetical protein